MKSLIASNLGKIRFPKHARRRPKFYQLKPRGALSRPPGAHLTIEVFNEKGGQFPAVQITAEAHGKMRALIEASKLEVSWLSPTKVTPEGDVIIYDVLVPHQECTIGSTAKLETAEVDGEDRLLCELMNEHRYDVIRDLICWGHSHVNSGVYASGLDEMQTQDYLRRMHEMGKTHFVRLVANKGDDLFASLYLLAEGKAFHNAPIQAEPPDTDQWMGWARREVKRKVKKKVYKRVVRTFDPEDYALLAQVFGFDLGKGEYIDD